LDADVGRPRKTGTRERERANSKGKKVLKKEETKESELELSTLVNY
jgi:hypothetical protein